MISRRQTDYAAVTARGDLVRTFTSYDLARWFASDHDLTVCRRTITLSSVDEAGRFARPMTALALEAAR